MDIQDYENLTGITISASQQTRFYAQVQQTQLILEDMLGFTLDQASVEDNEYTEIGKLNDTCPCSCTDVDEDSLLPADPVIYAYRLFPYNSKDVYLAIDPATAVNSVKLVKDGITFRTLDENDYRLNYKRGIVKFLEQCDRWCQCRLECDCVQLAVDADWLWDEDTSIPLDLQMVWANMITYYSDPKRDLKSQTLGTHSYTRFDREAPEMLSVNLRIINRYAGPNGSISKIPTV